MKTEKTLLTTAFVSFALFGSVSTYASHGEGETVTPARAELYAKVDDMKAERVGGMVIDKMNEEDGKEQSEIWVQPVNKKEACLIRTDKKTSSKKGFKEFWDGNCKDGYAYGLGLDIATAEGVDADELIYHNYKKTVDYGPSIHVDYSNKFALIGYFYGDYSDLLSRFGTMYSINVPLSKVWTGCFDRKNHMYTLKYATHWNNVPESLLVEKDKVHYWHSIYDPKEKIAEDAVIDRWYINTVSVDERTDNVYFIERLKNGVERKSVYIQGKRYNVQADEDYWTNLKNTIAEGERSLEKEQEVNAAIERMVREYLTYHRKNKVPAGLTKERYDRILNVLNLKEK